MPEYVSVSRQLILGVVPNDLHAFELLFEIRLQFVEPISKLPRYRIKLERLLLLLTEICLDLAKPHGKTLVVSTSCDHGKLLAVIDLRNPGLGDKLLDRIEVLSIESLR